jgi:hypothetical protein
LAWSEEDQEIIITSDPNFALPDRFYTLKIMDLYSCCYEPGIDEQILFHLLMVVDPYLPKNLVDQLIRLGNEGHHLQGMCDERKFGIKIFRNEEGRIDAEMSKGMKNALEPKTLMVEGETIIL